MEEIQYDVAGAPWLDQGMAMEGMRDPMYNLTDEQFAFVSQYWLFWYEADHRYALPTIALFLAFIIVFTLAAVVTRFTPRTFQRNGLYRRALAACRYLSYKSWRISFLHWYSEPAGVWLVGGVAVVFFLSMTLAAKTYYWPNTDEVNFGDSPPLATRSGWMSIACLPFVLVLAAKENPITLLTGVPHDRLMVFHRWAAWAMFALALLHTFPFVVYHIAQGDIVMQWQMSVFWWTGVVALLAQAWLQFMSIGFIRHKFYESFRALHYIMAALFWVFLFFHCDFILTSWDYLVAAAVVYAACLATSQLRTWAEHGIGAATIEVLHSGAVCIRIPTNSTWYPGQHIFVRFLTTDLHGLTSHPFTICSLPQGASLYSPDGGKSDDGEQENKGQEKPRSKKSEMIMFVQPRGGMTRRLASLARSRSGRPLRVMLDGPYGGIKHKSLASFQQALLIAGGAGAGFTLPVVESFLKQTLGGTVAENESKVGSSLRVILAVKTEGEYEWYASTMQELLSSYPPGSRAPVKVEIFITGSSSSASGHSGSSAGGARADIDDKITAELVDEESGGDSSDGQSSGGRRATVAVATHSLVDPPVRGHRPDLPSVISETIASSCASSKKRGSVAVCVCGPGGMLFDVRQEVAAAQTACLRGECGEVYMYSEHFSW